MPRILDIETDAVISLDECVGRLGQGGFDAGDGGSLHYAATALKQLANNRDFLGDMILDELKATAGNTESRGSGGGYSAQVIMLSRPARSFYLRANIWPAQNEYLMRSSGSAPFFYNLPHDHNFSFLTAGYLGPGYWSDYYEYDYDSVAGYAGEPVDLRYMGTRRLEQGQVMLYRAHRDVHVQRPADSLSVSLNIMQMNHAQGWYDQYRFDVENGRIAGILSYGCADTLLHLATAAGGDNGLDLAAEFAQHHPSERMQMSAWRALAAQCGDTDCQRTHYEAGLSHDSALVRGECRHMLAQHFGSD
ncbi:transposase [Sphingorhabdus sp. Alg239-R122]|uniref:transposase n=1 Tax=Sphingorhabdus sp. Alg239-R122 TaxID=2305989 RepID=UPI0019685C0A|nr:transposase [Sphingorhabdus sp. Alg239-R122]